uniref:N-acetyltransferase domain-containing protein n=1 Tax=Heterorhabditis bacteriophora TaxID=37862 RepID=A0A1I7X6R4_HETBA
MVSQSAFRMDGHVTYRDDPPHEVWLQLMRSVCGFIFKNISCSQLNITVSEKLEHRYCNVLASFFPVGCICSTSYEHRWRAKNTTILGLFYVKKEFRGRGIGNELFRRIIGNKQEDNLYLNGMSYMLEKYRIHYNFIFATPWKVMWYQVRPEQMNASFLHSDESTVNINDVTLGNLSSVLNYDSYIQNDVNRTSFIQLFLTQKCADSKVALEHSGRVVGIATARLLINTELFIGPLYAETPAVARRLLLALLEGKHKGQYRNLQLQIPSVNDEGRAMVEGLSMGMCTTEDYTVGLSTRFQLQIDPSKIYSTTEYDLSFV